MGKHDLLRLARSNTRYRIPVWIDVGRSDPFMNADTTLAAELRAHGTRVQLVVHGGGHSGWTGRMPRYLRFDAGACAA
jgi:dienelactone hydrolase